MDMSILNSTKKILGIDPEDTSFDLDIITHINSSLSILQQLGLGQGFFIQDETTEWDDLFPDVPDKDWLVNLVRTTVYLRVRMLFDPPVTSYLQKAFQDQIAEHEWRLNAWREEHDWVDPNPPPIAEEVI
jgi:hypothetical protein